MESTLLTTHSDFSPNTNIVSMVFIDYEDIAISRGSFEVLSSVSMKVCAGETIYIVGNVGSGKTSLIESFYAGNRPRGKRANVLEYDLLNITKKQIPCLRRQLGVIFQDFKLLNDRTVGLNLEFILKATGWRGQESINTRIAEVLNMVDMSGKEYKMPHELSGGECQRISIARALLNNPRIIIADEPTGNLDPDAGDKIFRLLNELSSEERSVIISTHNHSLIDKYPGKVLLCENHRLCHLP